MHIYLDFNLVLANNPYIENRSAQNTHLWSFSSTKIRSGLSLYFMLMRSIYPFLSTFSRACFTDVSSISESRSSATFLITCLYASASCLFLKTTTPNREHSLAKDICKKRQRQCQFRGYLFVLRRTVSLEWYLGSTRYNSAYRRQVNRRAPNCRKATYHWTCLEQEGKAGRAADTHQDQSRVSVGSE